MKSEYRCIINEINKEYSKSALRNFFLSFGSVEEDG
jgi:hypothetical protein